MKPTTPLILALGGAALSLSLAAVAQSGDMPAAPRVVQGTALPAAATQAAGRMVAAGAGGFSVGHGERSELKSLVSFGGMAPDTQYPIASASKFLAAATVMAVNTASFSSFFSSLMGAPVNHMPTIFPSAAVTGQYAD